MNMQRPVIHLSIALLTVAMGVRLAHADLVAYWSFDTDFTAGVGGPDYDATAFNGAQINGDQSKFGGGAAHFDKAFEQYASTAASPALDGTFSFSHWFYLDVEVTGPTPDRQYATVNSNNDASEPSLFFNIDGDDGADYGNDDDLIVYRTLTDGPGLGQSFLIRPFPRPTMHQLWVNFIATVHYDSGTNTTTVEGFLNGESLGFNGYGGSQQISTGKPEAATQLVFGADRGLVARFWEGWIDDVAIYDHVLSLDEIAALQLNAAPDIVVMPGVDGDYNGDGFVDAADYTVWRDNLGNASTLLNRDPTNEDPLVNQLDYAYWKTNYNPSGGGASSSVVGGVPEPAGVVLALLALGAAFGWRPRQRK